MTTHQTLRIPDWSSDEPLNQKQIDFYAESLKNRVYGGLIEAFARAATEKGMTRAMLAERVGMDRSRITNLLKEPHNMRLDTIATFLLGLDAEMDTDVVFLKDRPKENYVHPLIADVEKLVPSQSRTPQRTSAGDTPQVRASYKVSSTKPNLIVTDTLTASSVSSDGGSYQREDLDYAD